MGVKPQRGSRSGAEPLREVNIPFPHTFCTHIIKKPSITPYFWLKSVRTRDGYRQKNGITIYHDTGPAYCDTYHDTHHKI